MFGRRKPQYTFYWLRNILWPNMGWLRWCVYVWKRMLRINDTPHKVALGIVCGSFASFTPFVGMHFVVAGILAYFLGGSLLASAWGTAAGNPFTFPFIWISTLNLGNFILGRGWVDKFPVELSFTNILYHPVETFAPIILPMTIGGVPLGALCSLVLYWPVKGLVKICQARRRARIAARLARKDNRAAA